MLLALDAGNTNLTIGVFQGRELSAHWRLRTVHGQTADEWGILLRTLFTLSDLRLADVDGIIIASVVSPLTHRWRRCETYFHTERCSSTRIPNRPGICYENRARSGRTA